MQETPLKILTDFPALVSLDPVVFCCVLPLCSPCCGHGCAQLLAARVGGLGALELGLCPARPKLWAHPSGLIGVCWFYESKRGFLEGNWICWGLLNVGAGLSENRQRGPAKWEASRQTQATVFI